jgi:formylglycine-generating enzyme required for sulfatase activity
MEECIELQGTVYLRRGEGLYTLAGQISTDSRTGQVGSKSLLRWQGLGIPLNMILVEGGRFLMGASDCGDDAQPTHMVRLSRFLIGKYPVTFAEYDVYCQASGEKPPPDNGWGRGPRPVINISWHDAIVYCNWRSRQEGLAIAYDKKNGRLLDNTGQVTADTSKVAGYRLPTAAEWEYAARGGQKSLGYRYSGSNSLAEVAWYRDNAGRQTHPVGEKKKNELGIYDMSGNVWEWCQDCYSNYSSATSPTLNPIGSMAGSLRVNRGGSWRGDAASCRSVLRYGDSPDNRNDYLGFRLSRSFP